MSTGLAGLWAYFAEIRNDHRKLVQRVKNLEKSVTVLGGGITLAGDPIATLTGTALIGASKPVIWSKVKTEDDVTYAGSRIQLPNDGQYLLGWQLEGVWPRGYSKYDYIDGARVEVIVGGNLNAEPKISRAFVPDPGSTVQSHGVIHGYGNSVALGVTSTTQHRDGASTPTGVKVTLTVSKWIEG